jgi:ABC-type transporter MlaC component
VHGGFRFRHGCSFVVECGYRQAADFSDGRYKIQDVSVDGVSAAMSRRSQVEAMMSRAGGQVAALLATMRQEG